jgi:hypothetical protein
MVGVPDFSMMWRSIPSVRMGWPLPCRACIQRMKRDAHEHDHQLGREQRHPGPEGQVFHEVEQGMMPPRRHRLLV